jgi:uncharacterized protein (DUF1330 family)
MPAYVLSEVHAVDENSLARYRELAAASITQHAGQYLARGVLPHPLEGDWPDDHRLVLVQFPSVETATAWYRSPEYSPALQIRRTALERRLLLISGDH